MNQKLRKRISEARIGSTLILLLLSALWLMPTLALFIVSLRESTESQITGWWNAILNFSLNGWTLQAYRSILDVNDLGNAFLSSVAVTVPATVLPLLFAAYAAYGFTFLKFKGREFIFSIIIGLLVIPLQAALVPILKMFLLIGDKTGVHISGQFAAAWFVHSAFAMPLAVYILRNYMMSIPGALIEATRVDGASNFTIFWRLVLPISVPVIEDAPVVVEDAPVVEDSVEGYPVQVGRYGGKFIVVDGKKYYVGSDKQREYARNKIMGEKYQAYLFAL